jgi:hypothetical protein
MMHCALNELSAHDIIYNSTHHHELLSITRNPIAASIIYYNTKAHLPSPKIKITQKLGWQQNIYKYLLLWRGSLPLVAGIMKLICFVWASGGTASPVMGIQIPNVYGRWLSNQPLSRSAI